MKSFQTCRRCHDAWHVSCICHHFTSCFRMQTGIVGEFIEFVVLHHTPPICMQVCTLNAHWYISQKGVLPIVYAFHRINLCCKASPHHSFSLIFKSIFRLSWNTKTLYVNHLHHFSNRISTFQPLHQKCWGNSAVGQKCSSKSNPRAAGSDFRRNLTSFEPA